jgi:MinD superfamily P-loop ATPase
MLEITVISGKGGTGKTSLTGAFAHLAKNHVICDLDVDAPDLHLLLSPRHDRVEDFYMGHTPIILSDECTRCGECAARCRFEAVTETTDGGYAIDLTACEGCKVCVHFCPVDAIQWKERHCGTWYFSRTRFGPMVHAQLFPGQENSGKLVTLLRDEARRTAEENGLELILSDGSPGIGCPVISSLSGTDLAVLITEPTPSGLHDLKRVGDLCTHFRIPAVVIINKYDLNEAQSQAIVEQCSRENIDVVGRLPYDPAFTQAMVEQKVITEYLREGLADEVRQVWDRILESARMKKAA